MLVEIFTINPLESGESLKKLNSFLSTHKILTMRKEVIQYDGNSYWSFAIEY